MKKKLFTVSVLSLVSLSLALSGCGGKPSEGGAADGGTSAPQGAAAEAFPLKTTANVKIVAPINDGKPANKDTRLWQTIEKQTNVHVDWVDVNLSQWNEKKGLMFASNDLPDAMMRNGVLTDAELLNYGSTGAIIPLEKLIDQYAPNLKKAFQEDPELKKGITAPDGHIYAIPQYLNDWQNVETGYIPFVNKAWLDKLGMSVPKTTDEFEKMLQAFKEKDPGGVGKDKVIPLTGGTDLSLMFGAFGVIDRYTNDANRKTGDSIMHIAMKDGKVIYAPSTPEYKDAITYFAKLKSEGLLDQEAFTNDDKARQAKINTDPRTVGVFLTWRSTFWAQKPEQAKDYIPIGPLTGPKGYSFWEPYRNGLGPRGSFVITNKAKDPGLLMRWADNLLSDDNAIQLASNGLIGDYLQKQADGTLTVTRALNPNNPDENLNVATSRISFMTMSNSKRLVTKTPVKAEKGEYDKLYEGHFPQEVYPNVFFSKEEAQKIQTLGNDINTYANSMFAKWIMDGTVDKDWDGYIKKLNDMGLKDLLNVYQTAYERYKSSK